MTDDRGGGPDDAADEVRALLAGVRKRLDSLDEADDRATPESFGDLAERANALVANAEPTDLLAALSPSDPPTDERPETVADAIRNSRPEAVAGLRALLALARMDEEGSGEGASERVEELRSLVGVLDDGLLDGDDPGEAPRPEPQVEEASERSEDATEVDAGDHAERLRAELESGIDEFREGFQRVRDAMEADDEGEPTADEEGPSRSPAADGTMFSTVPSRRRGDKRPTTRLSTVRGKRGGGSG